MIYRILKIEEQKESIEYRNLNKVFWLGIFLICVVVVGTVSNFYYFIKQEFFPNNHINKLIVRGIHYIYYICFLVAYFTDWSYIIQCSSSKKNNKNNVEMNKYFLEM